MYHNNTTNTKKKTPPRGCGISRAVLVIDIYVVRAWDPRRKAQFLYSCIKQREQRRRTHTQKKGATNKVPRLLLWFRLRWRSQCVEKIYASGQTAFLIWYILYVPHLIGSQRSSWLWRMHTTQYVWAFSVWICAVARWFTSGCDIIYTILYNL